MTIQKLISKLQFSDFISILAFCMSGVAIFWNVYKDIVLKARVKVIVNLCRIVRQRQKGDTFIQIEATNYGPGSIICESIWLKKKSIFENIRQDYSNPLSSTLPKKLEVGENVKMLFPYEEKIFLVNESTNVGIMDSFNRIHWAERRQTKKSVEAYRKDFPEEKQCHSAPMGKIGTDTTFYGGV